MAAILAENQRIDTSWWIKHGIIGGIVGAIGMMMAEMLIAALMGMDAFMPPRMIAGMALGPAAMQPSTPLMTAAATGMMIHLVLSIVYGLIFAWIVSAVPALRPTPAVIVGASFYGLLLWLINFYVIAPPAGWVWFPTQANPVQQFISHVFAFGTLLGVYLDRALVAVREAVPSPARV
jgi:uncharacterized membrane protein YagU involved in acid resistance